MFHLTAGKDYNPVSQEVLFVPGQFNAIITIDISDDNDAQESDIFFSVVISVNGDIIAESIVTILDDDYNNDGMLTTFQYSYSDR